MNTESDLIWEAYDAPEVAVGGFMLAVAHGSTIGRDPDAMQFEDEGIRLRLHWNSHLYEESELEAAVRQLYKKDVVQVGPLQWKRVDNVQDSGGGQYDTYIWAVPVTVSMPKF